MTRRDQNEHQDKRIDNIQSWHSIMLTLGETQTSNIPNLKNIILQQIWHTGYRLVESHQQKSQTDMREHDARIFDDESKQTYIQFEISRAKRL